MRVRVRGYPLEVQVRCLGYVTLAVEFSGNFV